MVKYKVMKKPRGFLIFTLAFVIGDIVAILGAYSLAYIFRVKLSATPTAEFVAAWPYFLSLLALVPFIILFFSLIGTYSSSRSQKKSIQLTRIVTGAIGAMLFLITLDYFTYEPLFPAKLVPLYGLALSIVFLALVRGVLFVIRWVYWRRETNLLSVVVVGDNDIARSIIASISRPNSGYRLQAVVGDKRLSFTTHKTFAQAVRNFAPDVIVQVATTDQPTIDETLLEFSVKNFAELKFIPSDVNDLPDRVELELFMSDIPVLNIRQTALVGWGRFAKRLFDIAISALTLVALSPVFLVVGIANRIILGKVFFGHARLTRGDRAFTMYKFQTVRNDLNGLTPEQAFRAIGRPELIKQYRDNGDFLADDPRYGAWSRFLRKTSIDELPQLWNVLKGDISLVGPRALIPEELDAYEQKHLILNVKSGITGLAQVSGRRDLPWDQRRKLDIYYVQNWSFGLDLQILLTTAWQVLAGRGAQ